MTRADNPHAFSKPGRNFRFTEKKKQMTLDCQFNWHILTFLPECFNNFSFVKKKGENI